MKPRKHNRLRGRLALVTASALLCGCLSGLNVARARPAPNGSGQTLRTDETDAGGRDKISPDLRALADNSDDAAPVNVIIRRAGTQGVQSAASGGQVAVPGLQTILSVAGLDTLLRSLGGHVTHRFARLGTLTASVPPKAVAALASRPDVLYVSPDRKLAAAGHVETTTGTD